MNIIDRIAPPEPGRLQREYLSRGQPVILLGLFDEAPLSRVRTIAGAGIELADVPLEIQPNYLEFLRTGRPGVRRQMRFADYLAHLERHPDTADLCVEYRTPDVLLAKLPPPAYCQLRAPDDVVSTTFIAGAGNFNHLHFDDDQRDTLLYQVFGRKRVAIVDPRENRKLDAYLSLDAATNSALARIPARDANGRVFLERFSEADKAAFLRYVNAWDCVLEPGETLLIPMLAWHYIEYVDAGMSITYRLGRDPTTRRIAEAMPMPTTMAQTVCSLFRDAPRLRAERPDLVRALDEAAAAEYPAAAARAAAVERCLRQAFEEVTGESAEAVLLVREMYRRNLAAFDPAGVTSPGEAATVPVSSDVRDSERANLAERGVGPRPSLVRSVGVVGGGTAGYLTALALKRQRPELEITLIESSKVGIIGVGEATTALLPSFLHKVLGLDVVEFFREVQPTWKLGIRFEWGQPGDYYFNSPFQFGRLLESLVYERDINRNCAGSRLMTVNRAPVLRLDDGRYHSLLSEVPFAYHLDNKRFVAYLQRRAREAGILHKDALIADVQTDPGRRRVEGLLTEDGERLSYDLYVDCSGFRSLLIGRALGSEFVSYASSLLTDGAVVADVPHATTPPVIDTYTRAETMDCGWCWGIPMPESNHRGYVYASAFCSEDEAVAEMRRKNPGMGDHWTVRFRSGRHAEFWRGNVVALGNSYAFVEPLQSTAIHMILVQIFELLTSFPSEPDLHHFQPIVNRRIAEVWDHLRYFLAAHYRFNRRLDTPFWRTSRAEVDVSGIQDVIDMYRERAPIGGTPQRFRELDASTFGVYRHDLLFMGQQLPTTYVAPEIDRDAWLGISAAVDRVVARALPHAASMEALLSEPGMLQRWVERLE